MWIDGTGSQAKPDPKDPRVHASGYHLDTPYIYDITNPITMHSSTYARISMYTLNPCSLIHMFLVDVDYVKNPVL